MSQRGLAAMAATMVLQLVLLWSVAAQAETLQAVTHPEELGFDVTRLERMTKAFQGYVDAGQLPGAVVLIARHDQVAYAQAFGYLDREAKAAMTPDSIFRIASMTKPIVSVGAMMLVEEGKLDLAALPSLSTYRSSKTFRSALRSVMTAPGRPSLCWSRKSDP